MQPEKLSDAWLFQDHPKETVKHWLRNLRYFYFVRAWGGLANDGDEFKACFGYTDREDLLHKLAQFGIIPNTIPDDAWRPVPGQSYPSEEYGKFKNAIKRYPDLEQPGCVTVSGYPIFIWVNDHAIQCCVANVQGNNPYWVSDDDFKACLALEKEFDRLDWKKFVDTDMERSVCCISRSKYPELFVEETTDAIPSNTVKPTWWHKFLGNG